MANNIIAQVMGGSKQVLDGVSTVGEAKTKLGCTEGYLGYVNGSPENDCFSLEDGDMVTFSKAVKGGLI